MRKQLNVLRLCTFVVGLAMVVMVGTVQADLVAQYTFDDGTANDVSGNGLNGTLFGTAAIVNDTERGQVLSLDGIGGKVELGNPAGLNFVGECTIMAWVNSAVIPQTQPNAGIIQRGHQSGPSREFALRIGTSGTQYEFGTWSPNQHAVFLAPSEDAGAWVHMAGTMTDNGDSTWTYRLYRNGEEVASLPTATTGLFGDFTVGWAIGARGGVAGAERVWNGLIDDVQMYDHPLTLEEIQEAMTGTTDKANTPSPKNGALLVPVTGTILS